MKCDSRPLVWHGTAHTTTHFLTYFIWLAFWFSNLEIVLCPSPEWHFHPLGTEKCLPPSHSCVIASISLYTSSSACIQHVGTQASLKMFLCLHSGALLHLYTEGKFNLVPVIHRNSYRNSIGLVQATTLIGGLEGSHIGKCVHFFFVLMWQSCKPFYLFEEMELVVHFLADWRICTWEFDKIYHLRFLLSADMLSLWVTNWRETGCYWDKKDSLLLKEDWLFFFSLGPLL